MAEVRNPFTYTPQYVYEHHVFVGSGPVKKPMMPVVPPASDDYYVFLATIYGESARIKKAWEAVADSVVLRATMENKLPGQAAGDKWQYDAFIQPSSIDFSHVDFKNKGLEAHAQFLKAYAYLTQKTINGKQPFSHLEGKTIVEMDAQIRPIYALYVNKDVLLQPTVNADSPIQDETAPERYKTMNPKNPLKYYITNYYSQIGQGYYYSPEFLSHIPKEISADDYLVAVPDVNTFLFKFYNIPHHYH